MIKFLQHNDEIGMPNPHNDIPRGRADKYPVLHLAKSILWTLIPVTQCLITGCMYTIETDKRSDWFTSHKGRR